MIKTKNSITKTSSRFLNLAQKNLEQNKSRKTQRKTTEKSAQKDTPLRFVPLGGLEEIGRNCMFFEYKNEIVVVDAGLQFPE